MIGVSIPFVFLVVFGPFYAALSGFVLVSSSRCRRQDRSLPPIVVDVRNGLIGLSVGMLSIMTYTIGSGGAVGLQP